jgi:hypothetical protein
MLLAKKMLRTSKKLEILRLSKNGCIDFTRVDCYFVWLADLNSLLPSQSEWNVGIEWKEELSSMKIRK